MGSYCGPAPDPSELLSRWNFDPWALAFIVLLGLWARRTQAGVAGLVVLAFVFISPLCALSSALFLARVVHHVLLVAISAPLLALSMPTRLPHAAGLPLIVATVTLWVWHLPSAYDAALGHKAVYLLMQASLFGSAVLFWRAAFSLPSGSGVIWVFFAYLAMGMLGAILSLAPQAIYATHAVSPFLWGLSPLADQQLGGLIMWMPAALPFIVWGGMLARRAWHDMAEVS